MYIMAFNVIFSRLKLKRCYDFGVFMPFLLKFRNTIYNRCLSLTLTVEPSSDKSVSPNAENLHLDRPEEKTYIFSNRIRPSLIVMTHMVTQYLQYLQELVCASLYTIQS